MSDKSAIEWTDATWNPVTGCSKVSPGCAHCYIDRTPGLRIAGRRFVRGHIPLELHFDRLEQPLRWQRPRRIFVNSLSDLFHEDIPDDYIDRVFAVMALTPQHTYQVLTKRPERMHDYLANVPHPGKGWYAAAEDYILPKRGAIPGPISKSWGTPLPNVWLGVTVENQRWADVRVPILLDTPAAVRFVSAEPLLGPVNLLYWFNPWKDIDSALDPSLDWVIVGGESGPKPRSMAVEWARSIRDDCRNAGVPFFFKQWGGPRAKSGGRVLDGREWSEFPEVVR